MHADPPVGVFNQMLDRLDQTRATPDLPLPIFRCPSDNGTETVQREGLSRIFGRSNYAGVTGDGRRRGCYGGRRFPGSEWPDIIVGGIAFEAVRDGLSNTFAVGERDSEPADPLAAWFHMPGASCEFGPNSRQDDGTKRKDCFRSLHGDAGVHFLMADGAVRFVAEGIDLQLYRALSTSQGNEAVSEF